MRAVESKRESRKGSADKNRERERTGERNTEHRYGEMEKGRKIKLFNRKMENNSSEDFLFKSITIFRQENHRQRTLTVKPQ